MHEACADVRVTASLPITEEKIRNSYMVLRVECWQGVVFRERLELVISEVNDFLEPKPTRVPPSLPQWSQPLAERPLVG